MPDAALKRNHGKAFDRIATEYDRHRPTYPDQLIDAACQAGGLEPGDRVLEIGCGTGQLTGGLLARGLRVTAIEPGARLAAIARQRLQESGRLTVVNARFEDAPLPGGRYRAAFSASAIHWVDPDVGWRRLAESLAPSGTLALIQYVGVSEPRSAEDRRALLESLRAIAPQIAAEWPRHRDLDGTLAGLRERRENVSAAWSWLGDYELARDYAADLFDDAEIAASAPILLEHSAAELNALLGTLSFWSRLSADQRQAMRSTTGDLQARLGRPIRSSVLACLLTARRSTRRPPTPSDR